LIQNTEEELKRICEKMGLDFEENMLLYYETAKNIIGDDEMDWKKNVLKPIISDNTNKWSNELSKFKLFVIESILQKEEVLYPLPFCLIYHLLRLHMVYLS